MMRMKNAKIILSMMAAAIFAMAAYAGYYLASAEPLAKPPTTLANTQTPLVSAKNIIFEEGNRICLEYDLNCISRQKSTDATLAKLSLNELAALYPAPTWQISEQNDTIYLTQATNEGLCDMHKAIRHLGVNESGEYLAVLYGPAIVGHDGGVYQVTDLRLDALDTQWQQDILSNQIEIHSDDELIGLLDGLSEHQ